MPPAMLPQPPGRSWGNMVNRLDILTLKLFVAIVEEQSIARAAERENIVPSAVSKRISELEEVFRVPLLTRHHKGVEPTAAGAALLVHARGVLRGLEDLLADMVDYAHGVRGHIRLFANESSLVGTLPAEIAAFMAVNPNVRIELQERISSAVVTGVAENMADIGIFAGAMPTGDLNVVPYHSDRLVLVVPPGHPLADRERVMLTDMAASDLIGQQSRSSIDVILGREIRTINGLGGTSLGTRLRVDGFDAACCAVQAGMGIAIVPEQFATLLSPTLGIVALPIQEAWASRAHKLCTRRPSKLPAAVRLLLEHLAGSVVTP